MSGRVLLASFDNEGDLLGAARASRDRGFRIADVYTPYAVDGLSEVMALPPSRLSWLCFGLGLIAAALTWYFEFWASAVSWPINVGGKPWHSLPAFVPLMFEVTVLCAGVGTVIALAIANRLVPGKKPALPAPGITDDCFLLVLEETDAVFDPGVIRQLFATFNVRQIEERVREIS